MNKPCDRKVKGNALWPLLIILSLYSAPIHEIYAQGGAHRTGPYRARVKARVEQEQARQRSTLEQAEMKRKQSDEAERLAESKRRQMREQNLQQLREDLAKLITLATSMQEEVQELNQDQAPVTVMASAKEIEELAKRIKKAAKGVK